MKVAIVTGIAGGIGKASAIALAEKGYKVVGMSRNVDSANTELAPLGITCVGGDVSSADDRKKLFEKAVSLGEISVLVNVAGVAPKVRRDILEMTEESYDYVMGINVYGPLCSMRKACQVFLKQGNGGNIITVSSVGSMHQAAGAVYCASKAAVNAYSRHVAFTYMKEGIRSNIIAPGGIATEIGSAMGMPNMDGFQRVRPVQALAPAPGQPSDIANTALFLASDDSKYVNGVVMPVDGGWTAF